MKTIRMKRADWQKWDEALRSGRYVQGTGQLRKVDPLGQVRHCCLGVLEAVLDGKVEAQALPSPYWLKSHGIEFKGWSMLDSLMEWHVAPYLPAFGCDAVEANDQFVPFTTIADAIAEAVEFID